MLYDKETGTLWYPENNGLLGIQGVFFQRRLPKLKSNDTVFMNRDTYASISPASLIDRHEDANHGECWKELKRAHTSPS